MILQAGNGCYLTQSADVPMSERVFRSHVNVTSAADMSNWKEITSKQKDEMLAETAVIDVDNMDYSAIKRVDSLLDGIARGINGVSLSVSQSLELQRYYPEWSSEVGNVLAVGYKVQCGGSLYEVIQEHTAQADWQPGTETASLFKVVQESAAGTQDDPILWEQGMELTSGLYYKEGDVLYLCNRDSGIALSYALADLVDQYVTVVSK